MNRNKAYSGIDFFRLAAALLIVAIHTSPLASVNLTADFVAARAFARIAVPFFFMTSGYFMISRYGHSDGRLKTFLKKTAVIYALAILLYIPINIYNGYFKGDDLLPKLIKDIVFDGTFYHLWYLPASMLGAVIAWYSVRRLGFKRALTVTAGLYLVGMIGNSYYELVSQLPAVKVLYGLLAQISDHTRNGIFFAPVFMVLGGMLAEKPKRAIGIGVDIAGFAISMGLMLAEALLLRNYGLSKTELAMNGELNNSMYLFLLPCVYFLFCTLLHFRGKRRRGLRSASLIVYIIHPMMIIAVRAAARPLKLWSVLVENSIVHYLTVAAASAAFAFAAVWLWDRLYKPATDPEKGKERAWTEINYANLRRNARTLMAAAPAGSELMAVVKADAYGHGAQDVAACLEKIGVRAFAVATIEEGIELRKYGISGEILIMGYTSPYRAKELKRYDLIQTVIDLAYAQRLERQRVTVRTHIKIDTGMHRLGIGANDTESVEKIFFMEHIRVCGVYTHLCCSDSGNEGDILFTQGQIDSFYGLLERLERDGFDAGKIHLQSSYGLLNYPGLKCDYVRAGIALYGVLSSPSDETKLSAELRPVLSLKSRVALIRKVGKGESVGYGRSFCAQRDSLIAILPIGYCDGIPRSLSDGVGQASIHGVIVPIVGRVCMDLLAVDVTDIDGIAAGDVATLISGEPQSNISAPYVAQNSGSISNELLCRLGPRVK